MLSFVWPTPSRNFDRTRSEQRLTCSSLAARQVLVLHAIGYDGPRIAAEMSISQAAARKRLMRARFALRQAYVDPVVHENATRAQP